MGVTAISAKGGNLCQSWLNQQTMIFFLCSPEIRIGHFMQIVSIDDDRHEMSSSVFWEK